MVKTNLALEVWFQLTILNVPCYINGPRHYPWFPRHCTTNIHTKYCRYVRNCSITMHYSEQFIFYLKLIFRQWHNKQRSIFLHFFEGFLLKLHVLHKISLYIAQTKDTMNEWPGNIQSLPPQSLLGQLGWTVEQDLGLLLFTITMSR